MVRGASARLLPSVSELRSYLSTTAGTWPASSQGGTLHLRCPQSCRCWCCQYSSAETASAGSLAVGEKPLEPAGGRKHKGRVKPGAPVQIISTAQDLKGPRPTPNVDN